MALGWWIQTRRTCPAYAAMAAVGGTSAANLLGRSDGITRLRGRWLQYSTGARNIDAMAIFHPAYLLRQPALKRDAWRDLLLIREHIRSA